MLNILNVTEINNVAGGVDCSISLCVTQACVDSLGGGDRCASATLSIDSRYQCSDLHNAIVNAITDRCGANSVVTEDSDTDWKKYLFIGGGVLLGVGAIGYCLCRKRSSSV